MRTSSVRHRSDCAGPGSRTPRPDSRSRPRTAPDRGGYWPRPARRGRRPADRRYSSASAQSDGTSRRFHRNYRARFRSCDRAARQPAHRVALAWPPQCEKRCRARCAQSPTDRSSRQYRWPSMTMARWYRHVASPETARRSPSRQAALPASRPIAADFRRPRLA